LSYSSCFVFIPVVALVGNEDVVLVYALAFVVVVVTVVVAAVVVVRAVHDLAVLVHALDVDADVVALVVLVCALTFVAVAVAVFAPA